MPFQALPIAFHDNPGDPISKLLWIYMVWHGSVDDAPNGKGIFYGETRHLEKFCQCSRAEIKTAIQHLERCGLVEIHHWIGWGADSQDDELCADLNLPMSQLVDDERKRFKASPDQLARLAERQRYRCVGCGAENDDGWHADHIIPRSVGGADTEQNMQVLCGPCNGRKGARVHFIDFLGRR
jgi:hypothetical protein